MLKNALRATALLAVLGLSAYLSTNPAHAAGKPKGAAARRHSWLYNNGAFRKMARETWAQKNEKNNALFTFREVARTPQYVALYDKSRKMHVRLYEKTVYSYTPDRKKWTLLYQGRWADPHKAPLDLDQFPDERGKLTAATERKSFPHLGRHFQVLAPATPNYNCIAWTVGVYDQWVWPFKPGKEPTLSDFDELYRKHGYRRVKGMNFDYEAKQRKVVLYAKRKGNAWEPTHAARQLSDGSWASKLGCLPLVRHLEPNDLDGATYGQPIAVYVRPKTKTVAKR